MCFPVQTSPGTTVTAAPLLAMNPEATATVPAAVRPMVAPTTGISIQDSVLLDLANKNVQRSPSAQQEPDDRGGRGRC